MPQNSNEILEKIRWGIGRKLGVSFTSLIALTILIGVVALIGIYSIGSSVTQLVDVAQAQLAAAHDIQVNLLEARRNEKDFLLRYKDLGLEEARQQYVTAVQSYVSSVQKDVNDLRNILTTDEEINNLDQISQAIMQYETEFLAVVDLIEEKGFVDTGLEGEFRDAAHELEAELEGHDAALMVTYLTLRRDEKDYLLRGEEQYVTGVHNTANNLKQQIQALGEDATETNSHTTLIDAYLTAFDGLVAANDEIAVNTEEFRTHAHDISPLAEQIAVDAEEHLQTQSDNIDRISNVVTTSVIAGLVIAIIVGVTVSILMSRNITNPIRHLTQVSQAVATGDLEVEATVSNKDETRLLANTINLMVTRLREMLNTEQKQREYLEATVKDYVTYMAQVSRGDLKTRLAINGNGHGASDDPLMMLGNQLNDTTAAIQSMITNIRDAASNLSAAASEILAATTQQVSGSTEQSAAISQTTTTVDEVKTLSEQAIERAQEVVGASQRTVEISSSGQSAVDETIDSMAQIKERVEGIAENIVALSEQTQQIGEIIATVNDIAAQSNMLALNASVEAARAGEHGKGFAAVALEVRNLAEQSKQATSQVRTILQDIQDAINAAVMATEEGTKVVDTGVRLASRTGEVIVQLTSAISQASQTSMQVMAGGRQQASGVEQIALAMNNISQATQQGLASTRQAEKAAQDLNDLAGKLREMVEQYKV